MMKRVLFLLPLLLLAGCFPKPITRQEQLAIYQQNCLDYGYSFGTQDYANCMKEQDFRDQDFQFKERELDALERRNQLAEQRVQAKRNALANLMKR